MSAVKRLLSRDDIVIADGLNYIKGFRYQLYCEAKALQTPSCVVRLLMRSNMRQKSRRRILLFAWPYRKKESRNVAF
jgi:tRNA uridine 5-carbamoylmethylation protein Kti12